MKSITSKNICILSSLSLALSLTSQAASIIQNIIADDQRWFSNQGNAADAGSGPYGTLADNSSLISATDAISVNARQNYDERSLTFNNLSGTTIDELLIVTDLIPVAGTPVYDDGFAIDLNADNTIDYAFTQNDVISSPGINGFADYSPWSDASPLIFEIRITNTGTSISALWDGTPIQFGTTSPIGFNNASALTLQDLGFTATGEVPNNNFTTGSIRIGSINTIGGSGSASTTFNFDGIRIKDDMGNETFFDPDGDGLPANVPEPTTSFLFSISSLLFLMKSSRLR